MSEALTRLTPGMPIVYGGNRITHVDEALAANFQSGDRLMVLHDDGTLLHIPDQVHQLASSAVDASVEAFASMGGVSDSQVSDFYREFANNLEDDRAFGPVIAANEADVERAAAQGRSTTRLALTMTMRREMIEGLRGWATTASSRGQVVESVEHPGWRVDMIRAGIGVIGFVFEGRPNVFADATGVLRSGNTVVFRIGSAAFETAKALMAHALRPALDASGLPEGAVSLVESQERAAGWAMFSDARLSLAVARGSGGAVSQLGAVARQAGTPVSLHGTGGAWIVAGSSADSDVFKGAVVNSLDRKVCNTLNTCCIVEDRAEDLIPAFLDSLRTAADNLGTNPKLHVTGSAAPSIPEEWFEPVEISRSEGEITEPKAEILSDSDLGREWEWEASPEVTLHIVDSVEDAVRLFNQQSPRFAASLISEEADEHEQFFESIDSPFVGNGFTRWVDGQYALGRPELGLSNWQYGRLFGRGGVLSGDSAYTIRTRATQSDPGLRR